MKGICKLSSFFVTRWVAITIRSGMILFLLKRFFYKVSVGLLLFGVRNLQMPPSLPSPFPIWHIMRQGMHSHKILALY